jgi:5-methylthioadenosine/S-adenosylhomocysteine deaminase
VKEKLGSLEQGKFADFLVIDPAGLGAVLEDPYANLVLVTSERDVEQVFVGGDLKVEHGRVVQHDMAGIQKEVYRRVAASTR